MKRYLLKLRQIYKQWFYISYKLVFCEILAALFGLKSDIGKKYKL